MLSSSPGRRPDRQELRRPHVQVLLDESTLEESLRVAEVAAAAGVDLIEVSAALIRSEGVRAVQAFREKFPSLPIVAGAPIVDHGYEEVRHLAAAGASWCVVLGVAHPAAVKSCVAAGRDFGIGIMGDLLAAVDKTATARTLRDLGVDVVAVHTGHDEREEMRGASAWDDVAAVAAAIDLPLQASGGLWVEDLPKLITAGASLVVVSSSELWANAHATARRDVDRLSRVLDHVIRAVKDV